MDLKKVYRHGKSIFKLWPVENWKHICFYKTSMLIICVVIVTIEIYQEHVSWNTSIGFHPTELPIKWKKFFFLPIKLFLIKLILLEKNILSLRKKSIKSYELIQLWLFYYEGIVWCYYWYSWGVCTITWESLITFSFFSMIMIYTRHW